PPGCDHRFTLPSFVSIRDRDRPGADPLADPASPFSVLPLATGTRGPSGGHHARRTSWDGAAGSTSLRLRAGGVPAVPVDKHVPDLNGEPDRASNEEPTGDEQQDRGNVVDAPPECRLEQKMGANADDEVRDRKHDL